MTLTAWLTIVGICTLGAMSPGPSLAVVLKHTIGGNRRQGMTTAVMHGFGVGLYAFACISGLAVVILTSKSLFTVFQWCGALYLAWLGLKGLRSRSNPNQTLPAIETEDAARDGFMIVFLNPKIAVFFIALFSQVVGTDTTLTGKFAYASTAMIIDGSWYVLVAWLFSNPKWLVLLQQKAVWIDKIFGVVLLSLAGKLAVDLM